jgi:dienelactone hydrolase
MWLLHPGRRRGTTLIFLLSLASGNGLVIGAGAAQPPTATATWFSPPYAEVERIRTVALKLGPDEAPLNAVLTLPVAGDRLPLVILVHGSGPGDMDETLGPNKPFRDLAEGLATRGIAVLRYDKRTRIYPQNFLSIAKPTVQDEVIDDVDRAVALMKSRSDIDARRIIVLGHSLGGTLAPRIAAANKDVAGLVILAGATRSLPDIMLEQITYLAAVKHASGPEVDRQMAAIRAAVDQARAAKPGDSGPMILGAPPSYWGDLNHYDPAAVAATLSIPMLILQGDRDYQVRVADVDRFQQALAGHANAEIHVLAGLNHLFMQSQGTGLGTPADYDKAGHIDPEVIERIAGFVGKI